MPARLVALDEGPDIPLDRAMVVVGRHPQCDARLDSLRVSRHHCCMTQDRGDLIVRDLGSTNGIRINGQRVEIGRVRPGDELSIAHMRYRLDNGQSHEATLLDNERESDQELIHAGRSPNMAAAGRLALGAGLGGSASIGQALLMAEPSPPPVLRSGEERLLAAVREALPSGLPLPDRLQIQVIVQVPRDAAPAAAPVGGAVVASAEDLAACRPDSSQ